MAGDITKVKVEPCAVIWDGTDLGFTDGDIEISPEEQAVDITAHQTGSNILGAIRTGNSVSLSVVLKETSADQVKSMLLAGGGESETTAQVATLLCVADVAGSLNGKTFPLIAQDGTQYLFQLNVNGAAEAPEIPGWTVVQVALSTGATANAVADAVSAAIDALDGFAAPNPAAATITITWSTAGVVAEGSDEGNTGFTFTVTTPGASDQTGWGISKQFTNQLTDSAKLVLHPIKNADDDETEDLAFWKAYPMLDSITQSGENPKTVSVSFKIFHDYTQDEGVTLFALGAHS